MTFSEQFPIVLQALNVGFLQTLKLFAVTLIGAIPLGLVISFGSHSTAKNKEETTTACVTLIRAVFNFP